MFPAGITYENDGGALMLGTFSQAALKNCSFEGNEADDNGGAIFIKIRSKIILSHSTFKVNKAKKLRRIHIETS